MPAPSGVPGAPFDCRSLFSRCRSAAPGAGWGSFSLPVMQGLPHCACESGRFAAGRGAEFPLPFRHSDPAHSAAAAQPFRGKAARATTRSTPWPSSPASPRAKSSPKRAVPDASPDHPRPRAHGRVLPNPPRLPARRRRELSARLLDPSLAPSRDPSRVPSLARSSGRRPDPSSGLSNGPNSDPIAATASPKGRAAAGRRARAAGRVEDKQAGRARAGMGGMTGPSTATVAVGVAGAVGVGTATAGS